MSKVQFTRAMGLLDATAIVVGSMIGSGIFIVSAETARHLGSPGWMLVAWVLAGVLTVLGAVCYSELAAMYPQAGGQYIFLREAYGPLAAFLYGWTLFMVIQSGTIAAVAVAFAKFLGVFIPVISTKTVFVDIGIWKFTAVQLVALPLIAALTALNCRGIQTAKMIQTVFTVTKVTALTALIVLGLFSVNKYFGADVNFQNLWQPQTEQGQPLEGIKLIAMLSLAMVGPLFASDAWNNITFAGEEVKDAEKTLPRSLVLGTALVCALYILTNIVYLLLIPLKGVEGGVDVVARGIQHAAEDRVGTAAAQIIFGSSGGFIMAGAIMISTFGALNGLILAGPRAYYAMAKDRLFFKGAGELNADTHVPVYGLVLQAIWACLLATSGTYSQLLEFVVFAALLFYVLTVFGMIILRRKRPDAERPFKVALYPLLPVVYLVLASVVMIGQIYISPSFSGAGLLIILSGLPAFFIWKRQADLAQKAESE